MTITQFKYDIEYAEKVSLWLDIKVIFMTFVIIFKRIKKKKPLQGSSLSDEVAFSLNTTFIYFFNADSMASINIWNLICRQMAAKDFPECHW